MGVLFIWTAALLISVLVTVPEGFGMCAIISLIISVMWSFVVGNLPTAQRDL